MHQARKRACAKKVPRRCLLKPPGVMLPSKPRDVLGLNIERPTTFLSSASPCSSPACSFAFSPAKYSAYLQPNRKHTWEGLAATLEGATAWLGAIPLGEGRALKKNSAREELARSKHAFHEEGWLGMLRCTATTVRLRAAQTHPFKNSSSPASPRSPAPVVGPVFGRGDGTPPPFEATGKKESDGERTKAQR